MIKNSLRFRRISKDERTPGAQAPANQMSLFYKAKGEWRLEYRALPFGSRRKNNRWDQRFQTRICRLLNVLKGSSPPLPSPKLLRAGRHREELPGDEDIITGSAFLPAWAGLPADLPVDRQIYLTISLSYSCASCPSCEHARKSECQQSVLYYHVLRTTSFRTCFCVSFSSSPSFSPPLSLASDLTSKSYPVQPMYDYTPNHNLDKCFLS